MKSVNPIKSAAVLTIKRPGKMTKRGRLAVVAWLRRQAAFFAKYGSKYSETRFTARYLYR
jgi:hypothetical protein